jgi:pullulanase/glycogen debranching enzyme
MEKNIKEGWAVLVESHDGLTLYDIDDNKEECKRKFEQRSEEIDKRYGTKNWGSHGTLVRYMIEEEI